MSYGEGPPALYRRRGRSPRSCPHRDRGSTPPGPRVNRRFVERLRTKRHLVGVPQAVLAEERHLLVGALLVGAEIGGGADCRPQAPSRSRTGWSPACWCG